MKKTSCKTKISPRAIKKIELSTIDEYINWDKIRELMYPNKNHCGRKKVFTYDKMLKVCKLQDILGIIHDTAMAKIVRENETFQRFCNFKYGQTPSHDVISRFKREISFETLGKVFEYIDIELANLNFFENDQLCIDGTDLRLSHKSKIATWGAKSNRKKFCGLWLLTLNSTNREVIRDFVIDTAKVGQIKLFYRLIRKLKNKTVENSDYMIADGIFDNEKSYRLIKKTLKMTPIIPYNPRKSKTKLREQLDKSNWRFKYIKNTKKEEKFQEIYKSRTAVERENSRIKTLSLIKDIEYLSKTNPKVSSKWLVTQIILSLISINMSTLAQHAYNIENPLPIQTTITDFYAIA